MVLVSLEGIKLTTRTETALKPMETRCKHDLLLGQCSWCLGIPDAPQDNIATTYRKCAACLEVIIPGDYITIRVIGERRRTVGECCADE